MWCFGWGVRLFLAKGLLLPAVVSGCLETAQRSSTWPPVKWEFCCFFFVMLHQRMCKPLMRLEQETYFCYFMSLNLKERKCQRSCIPIDTFKAVNIFREFLWMNQKSRWRSSEMLLSPPDWPGTSLPQMPRTRSRLYTSHHLRGKKPRQGVVKIQLMGEELY